MVLLQVELTCEISALFRKADVRSADLLNWVDFSTFITQTSGALAAQRRSLSLSLGT